MSLVLILKGLSLGLILKVFGFHLKGFKSRFKVKVFKFGLEFSNLITKV